ncbi:MAG: alpha/beta hydrolase [Bryobacteraceae bacterium]
MTQKLSRRSIVAAALFAPAAGSSIALAQSAAKKTAPDSANRKFWTGEYWAQKNASVKLYMYRKRAAAPKAGEAALPVLLLIHGSSISSRSTFDLATPGKGEYSVMNVFASWGYDVWTLDHENYGRSSQTEGNSDIASGVEDLKAAVELIVKETGAQKVSMFGESSGALRAGAYAQARPERVERLILGAFTYKGENSPTLAERGKQLEYYRTHNRRPRDRKMIESIATRDKPGTTDPGISQFLADTELKFGEQVPTGTYLDMTANLPVVDPKKLNVPVMLIRGEYDGIATVDDLQDFFKQLPNGDRQFVIVPGMAHSVVHGLNRQLFWHAMHSFLTLPKPVLS